MGKVFITDEVNDNYTADVTNAGKVKVEVGAASFKLLSSAHTVLCGQSVTTSPCYLKSVIINDKFATATTLALFDTTEVSTLSSFGTSGSNIISIMVFDSSAALSAGVDNFPKVIPFDVYCSSGLTVAIGLSAAQAGGRVGAWSHPPTIVYQG